MSFRSSWRHARKARKSRKARTRQQWEADEWARIHAARRFIFTKQEIQAWEQKSRRDAPFTFGDALFVAGIFIIFLFIIPAIVRSC